MKIVLKMIIEKIMLIISLIFPYSFYNRFDTLKDMLYSSWIKHFVGNCGENVIIKFGCRYEGGGYEHICIGDNTTLERHCILGCWKKYKTQLFNPSIVIGNNCNIGAYTHISSIDRVYIGNGVLTGRYVMITDNIHGQVSIDESQIPPVQRLLKSKGPVVIGDNVWLGDKVIVLPGVHIGNNVIVAANAAVTKDIPSNCVVAGVPAKIVKRIE